VSDSKQELGRFFKHSTIYAIGNIVNRLGAFLLLPVYTNYLAVAEYGALELFYATAAVISSFVSVGIAHATLRFYYNYKESNDRKAVVSTNYLTSLAITILGGLLIGFWHDDITRAVFNDGAGYPHAVQIILVTLVFELSSQVCLAYLRAVEKSVFFIVVMLLKLLVQVSLNTYLVIVLHRGVEGVLFGNMLAVAFGWIVLSWFTLRACGLRFELEKCVPMLHYGFPLLLSSVTAMVSMNVDRFMLGRLVSVEALGLYGLAMKFALLLEQLIAEPFARAYGAFRFSIMDRTDSSEIQAHIVNYLMIGAGFAALGITIFAPELIKLMSQQDYWPAINLLPLLILAALIRLFHYPFQTGILVEKRTGFIFYINASIALLSVIANYTFIMLFGITGAVISQVVIATIYVVITNVVSQRLYAVEYDYKTLAIVLLVVMTLFGLSLPAEALGIFPRLAAKSVIILIFIPAIAWGVLKKDEKAAIATWLATRFGKRA